MVGCLEENMIDGINGQKKEEMRLGVSLSKATAMLYGVTRHTIKEGTRGQSREERPNPIKQILGSRNDEEGP
jgi:hypothetical protein